MSDLKSPRERQLLGLSKSFERAFIHRDLSLLDEIFAKDVTVHADQITLLNDIKGRRAALLWYQAYFDKYHYEHEEILGSVNEYENVTFALSLDKGVKPHGDVHKEQHKKVEVKPSNTVAIKMLKWNKQDELTDIWDLRQLSYDEAHRKLKEIPDYSKLSLDVEALRGHPDDIQPSPERRSLHERNTAKWNQIFFEKAPELVDEVVADKAKLYNIVIGNEHAGTDDIKETAKKLLSAWDVKDTRAIVGTTAGNKAFDWWQVTGTVDGYWTTLFGLTLLVFDKEGKIVEVVSGRQPTPQERKKVLKADI